MPGDQGSGFEWRRKRGRLNRTLERIEDLPWNLLSGRGATTDSAKRKLCGDPAAVDWPTSTGGRFT